MRYLNSVNAASMMKRIGAGFVAWLGGVQGLEWFWQTRLIESPELIWAYSVATGFFALYILATVCAINGAVLKAEIDRCAEAKSKLEHALLRKRQSSGRGAKAGKGGRR